MIGGGGWALAVLVLRFCSLSVGAISPDPWRILLHFLSWRLELARRDDFKRATVPLLLIARCQLEATSTP